MTFKHITTLNWKLHARFKVLIVVLLKIGVFWDVILCCRVSILTLQ